MSEKTPSVLSCRVSDVSHQSKRRMGPTVVRFEHAAVRTSDGNGDDGGESALAKGFAAPEVGFSFEDGVPSVRVAMRAKRSKRAGEGGGMEYNNRVASVRRLQHSPYQKTFLALRDKTTNTIKLVEANVATLGAVVEPPPSTNPLLLKDPHEEQPGEGGSSTPSSALKMKRHLVRQFGQAKGQRIYEQAEANKVDETELSEKVLEAAMSVPEEKLVNPQEKSQQERLTPPMNRDARDVLDVYSAADLVTPDEMSAMRGDAETYLSSFEGDRAAVERAVDARHVSPFLGSLLKKLVTRPASPAALDALGLALYAEAVFLLVKSSPKALQDRGPALLLPHLLPAPLRVKIFECFTEGKRLTPVSRDSAICHAMVAGLLASGDFQVEYQAFATTFRKKVEEVKRLASVCGARMVSDALTGQKFVTLRLPLSTIDLDERRGRSGRQKVKDKLLRAQAEKEKQQAAENSK